MIGPDNKQIGVVSKQEALTKAFELGVDLVEISSNTQPPVCKLIDFKKFKYNEAKKEREGRKNVKNSDLKEIRLSPFIGEHDLTTQLNKAKDFLKDSHRVRVTVKFTGRQMAKTDFGRKLLQRVLEELKDQAKLEREIKMEGRQMVMFVSPL